MRAVEEDKSVYERAVEKYESILYMHLQTCINSTISDPSARIMGTYEESAECVKLALRELKVAIAKATMVSSPIVSSKNVFSRLACYLADLDWTKIDLSPQTYENADTSSSATETSMASKGKTKKAKRGPKVKAKKTEKKTKQVADSAKSGKAKTSSGKVKPEMPSKEMAKTAKRDIKGDKATKEKKNQMVVPVKSEKANNAAGTTEASKSTDGMTKKAKSVSTGKRKEINKKNKAVVPAKTSAPTATSTAPLTVRRRKTLQAAFSMAKQSLLLPPLLACFYRNSKVGLP